jgi:hypothetical protein
MSSWKNNGYIPSGMNGSSGVNGYKNSNNNMMYPQQQQQQHPHPHTTTGTPSIETNGPRAKCDQVVFEAIAKAAEIVVGSRCWIDPVNPSSNHQKVVQHPNVGFGGNGGMAAAGNTGSSSRFNLFVPEVQGVR